MKVYAVLFVSPVTGTCRAVVPELVVTEVTEATLAVVADCASPPMYGVTT